MLKHEIHLQQVETLRALTLRFTARNHWHFAQVWAEIRASLQATSFRASAHPIQIIYAGEYREDDVDTEITLSANDTWTENIALPGFGTMTVRQLPGVSAASYLYAGDPRHLNDRRDELQSWASTYGYNLGASIRIVYLRGLVDRLSVGEWLFEIQHPLEIIGVDRIID